MVALNRPSVPPTAAACGSVNVHARHGLVVGLALLPEDVGRYDLALVLADVGQLPDAGDVADRPQALSGAEPFVDGNPAAIRLDPDGLQADTRHARSPARGDEQVVAAKLTAVVQLEDVLVALVARRACLNPEE